jgi:hypothetical protein
MISMFLVKSYAACAWPAICTDSNGHFPNADRGLTEASSGQGGPGRPADLTAWSQVTGACSGIVCVTASPSVTAYTGGDVGGLHDSGVAPLTWL